MECNQCGSTDIFSIRPGNVAVYAPGGILIEREVRCVVKCRACFLNPLMKEHKMTVMTGKVALEAHNLLTAIDKAMKGRGDKAASAAQFLAELHAAGYDVVAAGNDFTIDLVKAAE